MSKLTPMMQQYQAIKAEHRDSILFFRMGDFYEMFGQDAIEASKLLDITLTARNKQEDAVPMCGVPFHAAENYIARLIKAGRRVAICEQTSDPKLPGIVKREVVRVVTPGTTYSEQILEQKESHFIVTLFPKKDYFGLAFADLTTGEFQAVEFQGEDQLKAELLRLRPAEMVLADEHYQDPVFRTWCIEEINAPLSTTALYEDSYKFLLRQFKLTSLEAFGIANMPFAVQASAVLYKYLLDTQKEQISHIDRITLYHPQHYMHLDEASIRNLELFKTLRGEEEEATLLSVLDETETAFGGRMLRRWLSRPLLHRPDIEERHEAVQVFVADSSLRNQIKAPLSKLLDLERLLARLGGGAGNARDLLGLAESLEEIPQIKTLLKAIKVPLIKDLYKQLDPLEKLVGDLRKAILDEPSSKLREGQMIREGWNKELDVLQGLMKDGKSALKNIEAKERTETGIPSLKVSYNKVFGYHIEVSKTHLSKVPARYVRRQTLANAERYITDELREYEEKVLTAEERAVELEFELFLELKDRVLDHVKEIKQNAEVLAILDVLVTFASISIRRNYVRPEIVEERILSIDEGRHPVVESMSFEQSFIPNDTEFKGGKTELKLVTGPNMSGKSTYLRQVALIALMAQIGCFVPAKNVKMGVFDRIFTRVGASDHLARGQSTFMVEMQESAYILNHATDRSLLILDEVGRGTSTYDGLSLAWAILEFLHDQVRAFTLFATHYHELIGLVEELDHAKNYAVEVKENKEGVLFLHKVTEGAIDRSYGIEVARLSGMPPPIIERASILLHQLEEKKPLGDKRIPDSQMSLFSRTYPSGAEPGKLTHPALERLKSLDVNSMTPLQALNTLSELKRLKEE